MTEEEAHRYLQKTSMDSGTNLVETAQMLLTLMRSYSIPGDVLPDDKALQDGNVCRREWRQYEIYKDAWNWKRLCVCKLLYGAGQSTRSRWQAGSVTGISESVQTALILIRPSDLWQILRWICIMRTARRGAMCGNGIRCVAKYVYDYGLTDQTRISPSRQRAGSKTLHLTVENRKGDSWWRSIWVRRFFIAGGDSGRRQVPSKLPGMGRL